MITQDLVEIQTGNTAYFFSYFKETKNIAVIPSTATITILDTAGTEILSSTAMTIDSVTGECTYSWDSSAQETGKNYQVKFTIDGKDVVRFFDVYLYPFRNDVTDDDLFTENDTIKKDVWEVSGESESGTVNTLVHSDRNEQDDYWNGGIIEIFQGSDISERKVIDFVNSTNTITFSPNLTIPVGNHVYTLRRSYQDQINYAGNKVQLEFKKISKRAYLVIDHYQLKYLIIYKFFANFFQRLRKEEGDQFDMQHKYYADKYASEFESVSLMYDEDSDGIIDDGEDDKKIGSLTWLR